MEGPRRRKRTWGGNASLSKPSPLWNLVQQKGLSKTSSVSASFSTQRSKSQESFGRSRYLWPSCLRDGSRYQIRWIFGKVISDIRVCFFNNCIEKNQNKTDFEEGSSSHTIFWLFRSNKGWIRATKVWQHEYQWSFRCLEVSLPEKSSLVWLCASEAPAPLFLFFYFSACACAIKHSISTHLFWLYSITANS